MTEKIGNKAFFGVAERLVDQPSMVLDKLLVDIGRKALEIDPVMNPKRATIALCDMIAVASAYGDEQLADALDANVAVIVASGFYTVVQPEIPGVALRPISEEAGGRIGTYLQAALSALHPQIFGSAKDNPITDYLNSSQSVIIKSKRR